MKRKIFLTALSGALLLAQNAMAIETPAGWKMTPESADANNIMLAISPSLSNDGKTAAQLLENAEQNLIDNNGAKITQSGKIEEKDGQANIAIQTEINGSPILVKETIYPLDPENMRDIIVFMPNNAEILQKYQKTAEDIIAAQYTEDMARKK